VPRPSVLCQVAAQLLGALALTFAFQVPLLWAQGRAYHRYGKLMALGKPKQKVITVIARELLDFIWAIGVQIEQSPKVLLKQAA
jgi:hypothetical protein